jgi:peptidoglycan/xylan/chitin deacetylase (PgdA/CDA1 family)/uncharacterized caspase-like protein
MAKHPRIPSLVVAAALLAAAATACQRTSEPGVARVADATTAAPSTPPSPTPAARELATIVGTYRQIIVLLESESSLDPPTRARANVIGRILFQQNHERLNALGLRLGADVAAPAPTLAPAFLDTLERDADWHDADKLVFRDVVDELQAALKDPKAAPAAALRTRIESDQAALREIQSLYEKELDAIFGRFETRGMAVRREAWESYVAFLKRRTSVEAILKEHDAEARAGEALERAGGDTDFEISGLKLPAKSLVLTFDDGPHPRYTDRILEILKKFGVKAVFFQLGQNLGVVRKGSSAVQPVPQSAASRRLIEAGFPLANHSYSHPLLPRLSDEEIAVEIEKTNQMLRDVSHTQSILFRPPYGARSDKVRAAIKAHKMTSVLWNIDSRDWADPVPKSIANRVIQTVEGEKRGIILFHDIQGRTAEALPLVLETLKARGYRFLAWSGSEFVNESPPPPPAAAAASPPPAFYRESWAVVVGIDTYKSWPRLQYASNDARAVRELLVSKFAFKPDNVTLLLNEEATRERILAALDQVADGSKVKKDDRVFVFFAGHGVTRRLPSGRSLGYIVPADADQSSYQSQAISMTNFQDVSEAIPAKHVFFVMDACYSGVALTRGGAPAGQQNYLAEVTRRTVRQMLTAGGADEEVADNGPSGHSIFTWTLTQGLEGKADLNGDGYITASELATYVAPTVSSLSRQTPAFGNLVGSEGGDFVFELSHESEFLSEVSSQLDQQAIQLNSELDRIRAEIAAKRSRNEQLQRKLALAQTEFAKAGVGTVAAPPAPPTWAAHNDRGTALFREKNYLDAFQEFLEAARLAPDNALAANNVGFAYYKLEKYEEAVRWFQKTLALDPKRSIAWANLGDAYVPMGKKAEARKAYETFLEQQPSARHAPTVRRKLGELE